MDASKSSDKDGDSLTYLWTQTEGPDVELSSETAQQPTFTAPNVDEETVLTFSLTVNDGIDNSEADTVNVTVKPVIGGSFTVSHEGTATLTKAKGDFEADDYAVEVEITADYQMDSNGLIVIDNDSRRRSKHWGITLML